MSVDALLQDLEDHVRARGVAILTASLDVEKPAEFDGLTITLNVRHDAEARSYYLAHSFGSIVAWCVDPPGVMAMFRELREAKQRRDAEPDRLAAALEAFRAFEVRASEYSVWVLREIGHGWAVPAFSVFFCADLEAITTFHRTGQAPVWPAFLRAWKAEVASGARAVAPFTPRPVPVDFQPIRIEKQEVEQER